eukprot:1652480-Amphidinium_carterae.1
MNDNTKRNEVNCPSMNLPVVKCWRRAISQPSGTNELAAVEDNVVEVDADAEADVEIDVEDVDKLELAHVLVDVLAGVDELELAGSVLLLRSMLESMLRMLMCCLNWSCDEQRVRKIP